MQQQQRSCMNSISSPAHETHHKDAEWFSLYTELVARFSSGCFGQTYFQKVPGAACGFSAMCGVYAELVEGKEWIVMKQW